VEPITSYPPPKKSSSGKNDGAVAATPDSTATAATVAASTAAVATAAAAAAAKTLTSPPETVSRMTPDLIYNLPKSQEKNKSPETSKITGQKQQQQQQTVAASPTIKPAPFAPFSPPAEAAQPTVSTNIRVPPPSFTAPPPIFR